MGQSFSVQKAGIAVKMALIGEPIALEANKHFTKLNSFYQKGAFPLLDFFAVLPIALNLYLELYRDNKSFPIVDVQTALESTAIPLGVIAWTKEGERLQGSKMAFPWVKQDPAASEVFERICEEAREKVGEEFQRRIIN